jgi:twin-arginine translocation pathway signal
LAREGYRSPTLLWYLDYCCRDDYGAGAAQVSAFAGLHYFAARGHDDDAVLTWPDGLAHLSQLLRERSGLQPLAALPQGDTLHFAQPAALDASAVRIRETAGRVEVLLRDNHSGALTLLRAHQVISAMPLMVVARIVGDADRYGLLAGHGHYAPWLVSNFVLHRFPAEPDGTQLAWDNVIHGSPALGYVAASNQLIRVAKPARTVFTAYHALNHADPAVLRTWLLDAPDAELLAFAAQDLVAAYGKRFWRAVDAVEISIRAHAMRIPLPGYLDDPQLAAVRAHRSRLHFAHSDMSGYSVFEEAAYWGVEAARRVLAR